MPAAKLIENERIRLRAAVLNMASASSFVAGVLVPIVAGLSGTLPSTVPLRVVVAGAAGCLMISLVLHRAACEVLEGLQE